MTRSLVRLAAVALLPLTLILSGCFALENRYVVNEDGSGSQSIRFSVPAALVTGLGEDLPDVAEMESDAEIEALRAALGDMGSMTFFSNVDDGIGFELTVQVDASDDFAAALEERAALLQAAVPADMDMSMLDIAGDELILRRDGNAWIFEIRSASLDSDALAALTGEPDAAMMADLFLDQTTILTSIHLAGEVTEHNADEILEDGTLVWHQTGVSTERVLSARSDIGGGGLPTMVLAGILTVVIAGALAFGGLLLLRRNRGTT